MRVLQLIDSLNPGGAERIAVTFANSLLAHVDASFLCVTREEGLLNDTINDKVGYTFLQKKKTLDLRAISKLFSFIKKNKITIIHAHSTSFFIATLVKIRFPKLKLIWHDHSGKRVNSTRKNHKILYRCSFLFNKIVTVNNELKKWSETNLRTRKVIFLPNFIVVEDFNFQNKDKSKKIICVANLRVPKNHLNLLKAFNNVHKKFPDWTLQLVGKDNNDSYSNELKKYILQNNLSDCVDLYGLSDKVTKLLSNARIGVLSSDSEGLPMSLLEYGASGLAVITTNVGYCKEVINSFGKTVAINNSTALSEAIIAYIEDENKRILDAELFKKHIINNYSFSVILPLLLKNYKD